MSLHNSVAQNIEHNTSLCARLSHFKDSDTQSSLSSFKLHRKHNAGKTLHLNVRYVNFICEMKII